MEEEDKVAQLQNYREQLEVLEAALADPTTSDEDREALAETRSDLIEVIKLLDEVVSAAAPAVPDVSEKPKARDDRAIMQKNDQTLQRNIAPPKPQRGHELIGRTCEVQINGSWY